MSELIKLSSTDILNAERELYQFLQDIHPNIDFRRGTATRETLIKPMASIFAIFKKEVESIKKRLSLDSILSISGEELSVTRDELVDSLLSNWFLTRKGSNKTVGYVNIIIETNNKVTIAARHIFTSGAGLIYNSTNEVAMEYDSKSFVEVNKSEFGEGTKFKIQVQIEAVTDGSGFNLSEGATFVTSGISNDIIVIEAASDFASGITLETNEAFIKRAKIGITTRNLCTPRSIITTLLDNFNGLSDIDTIGFSDSEMQRDRRILVLPDGSNETHIGGMVDIYAKATTSEQLDVMGSAANAQLIKGQSLALIEKSAAPIISSPLTKGLFKVYYIGNNPLTKVTSGFELKYNDTREYIITDGNTYEEYYLLIENNADYLSNLQELYLAIVNGSKLLLGYATDLVRPSGLLEVLYGYKAPFGLGDLGNTTPYTIYTTYAEKRALPSEIWQINWMDDPNLLNSQSLPYLVMPTTWHPDKVGWDWAEHKENIADDLTTPPLSTWYTRWLRWINNGNRPPTIEEMVTLGIFNDIGMTSTWDQYVVGWFNTTAPDITDGSPPFSYEWFITWKDYLASGETVFDDAGGGDHYLALKKWYTRWRDTQTDITHNFKVEYLGVPLLSQVDDFVNYSDNTVLISNNAVKGYHPAWISFTFPIKVGWPDDIPLLTETQVTDEIVTYINNFDPSTPGLTQGQVFESSDLVNFLYTLGIDYVELPLTFKLSLFRPLDENEIDSKPQLLVFNSQDRVFVPDLTTSGIPVEPSSYYLFGDVGYFKYDVDGNAKTHSVMFNWDWTESYEEGETNSSWAGLSQNERYDRWVAFVFHRYGISNRTIQYMTTADSFTVEFKTT